MNLDNKVALVTGGASGLGQATVEKFVEKGAKTVILDLSLIHISEPTRR